MKFYKLTFFVILLLSLCCLTSCFNPVENNQVNEQNPDENTIDYTIDINNWNEFNYDNYSNIEISINNHNNTITTIKKQNNLIYYEKFYETTNEVIDSYYIEKISDIKIYKYEKDYGSWKKEQIDYIPYFYPIDWSEALRNLSLRSCIFDSSTNTYKSFDLYGSNGSSKNYYYLRITEAKFENNNLVYLSYGSEDDYEFSCNIKYGEASIKLPI